MLEVVQRSHRPVP